MALTKGLKGIKRGVHLQHNKNTAELATVKMPVPGKVLISMLQHSGAPCEPIVKKGDPVKVGQLIGVSKGKVSALVHSSVSGKVSNIIELTGSAGNPVQAVEIETDGLQEVHEDVKPPRVTNREEFIEAIKMSGLVGLGGAGFPTHIKLSPPADRKIDTLVINASECEPYITSDYREMMENGEGIVNGINLVLDYLEIERAIIAIESNKPAAIEVLKELVKDSGRISVEVLTTRYPQGAERTLLYVLTKRRLLIGQLPMDIGCIMMNVNTVSFVDKYLRTGMPLISKRITVDGTAVKNPQNVEVLVGTSLKDVFDYCGGFKEEPAKIIMGGPMMGVAQYSLEKPVLKQTNALLALTVEEARLPEESPCIKCTRCAMVCPMHLMPMQLNIFTRHDKVEELERYYMADCIECGCCSYICPAKIHLTQTMKLGKLKLSEYKKHQKKQ
jgi:electron transport complex protein RnfC